MTPQNFKALAGHKRYAVAIRFSSRVIALTAIAASLTLIQGTSVYASIINGSFETPVVPAGGFSLFYAGDTSITGWTVETNSGSLEHVAIIAATSQFGAHSGNQWIDLEGSGSQTNNSGVSQQVATTIGQEYELSFYVGSTTNNGQSLVSTVDLSIDSGAKTSFVNPTAPVNFMNWMPFTHRFTASSTNTDIAFFHGGSPGEFMSGLDSITLRAVPEPTTACITLLALCSAQAVRMRA